MNEQEFVKLCENRCFSEAFEMLLSYQKDLNQKYNLFGALVECFGKDFTEKDLEDLSYSDVFFMVDKEQYIDLLYFGCGTVFENEKQALLTIWLTERGHTVYYDDIFIAYGDSCFSYGNKEYLVYTDDEATEAAEDSLRNYIDDCIYPEIPENLREYFNEDKFIEDCISIDGRGHILSSWDGAEHEIQLNKDWYYIYRTN